MGNVCIFTARQGSILLEIKTYEYCFTVLAEMEIFYKTDFLLFVSVKLKLMELSTTHKFIF